MRKEEESKNTRWGGEEGRRQADERRERKE